MNILQNQKSKPKVFFLYFKYNKSAEGDYYRSLPEELVKRGFCVKIITSGKRTQNETYSSYSAIYTWPSYRPTNVRDAWFLYKLKTIYSNPGSC